MLCPERSQRPSQGWAPRRGAHTRAPAGDPKCIQKGGNGLDSHAPTNTTTDTLPCTGLQAQLQVAYHLVLSGWEVSDAATWMGLRLELVRSVCPGHSAQRAAS